MLAQNFKSAAELGLKEDQRAALEAVLRMLERKELKNSDLSCTIKNGFNMSRVWLENECGTVGCMAGWARHLSQREDMFSFDELVGGPHNISILFMYGDERRHNVSVEQAAIALRHYLTTGVVDWDSALTARKQ